MRAPALVPVVDLLGHGAVWLLTQMQQQDDLTQDVQAAVRDLAGTALAAAEAVRHRPVDAPPDVDDLAIPAAEALRLSVAEAMTAFAECGALNQPIDAGLVGEEGLDGEALCLRLAALHWRTAAELAIADRDAGRPTASQPPAEVLDAVRAMLPGLSDLLTTATAATA